MNTEFSLDLRHTRRKSGLSQKEVAFLLEINQSTYSAFERGTSKPSTEQLCALSLIYGKSFQSFFEQFKEDIKPKLANQLSNLPKRTGSSIRLYNRQCTLDRLAERLNSPTQ